MFVFVFLKRRKPNSSRLLCQLCFLIPSYWWRMLDGDEVFISVSGVAWSFVLGGGDRWVNDSSYKGLILFMPLCLWDMLSLMCRWFDLIWDTYCCRVVETFGSGGVMVKLITTARVLCTIFEASFATSYAWWYLTLAIDTYLF